MAPHLLIALALAAEPTPARVYRSRAELPEVWAAAIPPGFDWEKEMLAGTALGNERVVVVKPEKAQTTQKGVVVTPKTASFCPPCRGRKVLMEDDFRGISKTEKPLDLAAIYRLPRSKAKVYVEVAEPEICRPCTGL